MEGIYEGEEGVNKDVPRGYSKLLLNCRDIKVADFAHLLQLRFTQYKVFYIEVVNATQILQLRWMGKEC